MSTDPVPTPRRTALAITVSDRTSDGTREDTSGRILIAALEGLGYDVHGPVVVPDGIDTVAGALREGAKAGHRLIISTGGTGIGPRDLTPEATRQVITRESPGLAELLRHEGARHTPFAAASRGITGVIDWPQEDGIGGSLVINLPGRPSAVQEGMDILGPLLPHLLDQVAGGDH